MEAKEKQLMTEHRDQHVVDAEAKNARWPNMYGDQNPQPDVAKDMVAGANTRAI